MCVHVCVEGGVWMHKYGCVYAYLFTIPYTGIILFAPSTAPPYFLTLSHIWHNF